ncbi:MAG: 23S rRNA (adenine(2503)-C(2))-methyltransferase RlmN [Candidatus Omnitrophica bacterium]|nr:23S rRNA (adenine(2503)-C(2))-methyltransferase RlmN [Candidatus Omnitrophota bacterium]
MQAILDLTIKDLEYYLKSKGFPNFTARQIFSWIYKKAIFDFERMSDLSKSLRNFLKQNFYILGLALIQKQISSDGTQKFFFSLSNQQVIESVFIPTPRRLTVCISTQVGCKFACRFCASGAQGWQRNLTSAEIIEQIIYPAPFFGTKFFENAERCGIYLKTASARVVNNLVFMGVGEPLDNYDHVLKAVRILNSPDSVNIGARKMTISTCGLIAGIQRLAGENLQVELSVSLHAGDNQTRTYLMPINKKFPLEKLLPACRNYYKKTKRQITFEYVLIQGINSDLRQARKLTKLLAGLDAKVNLIPVNPFRNEFSRPNKLEILLFRDILLKAGIPATIRRPRGVDIHAACGQLRLRSNEDYKRDFEGDLSAAI